MKISRKGQEAPDQMKQDWRKRHEYKVRAKIRRLCQLNDMRYMWTLTYEENMTELDQAWRDFTKFRRRINRYCTENKGQRFPFLAIVERQKRGACHFHLVTNEWFPQPIMERIWNHGYVYVSVGRPEAAAGYVTKYLTKAMAEVPPGKSRYTRSRGNLLEPEEETGYIENPEQLFDRMKTICLKEDTEGYYLWGIQEMPTMKAEEGKTRKMEILTGYD